MPITVTASSSSTSLVASYTTSGGQSSLTVGAQANGGSLNGMFVALEQGGSVIATGFTPVTFSLTAVALSGRRG